MMQAGTLTSESLEAVRCRKAFTLTALPAPREESQPSASSGKEGQAQNLQV